VIARQLNNMVISNFIQKYFGGRITLGIIFLINVK
jgi:hypothetical protein